MPVFTDTERLALAGLRAGPDPRWPRPW